MRRIIGIGSPFGADQLGWRAIDLLAEAELPDSELIKLDRPGSDLLRYLEGEDPVVLIDAVQAGLPSGSVMELEPAELATRTGLTSSHGFGVAETIALAARLNGLPADLQLIGIETGADPAMADLPDQAQLMRLLSGADVG